LNLLYIFYELGLPSGWDRSTHASSQCHRQRRAFRITGSSPKGLTALLSDVELVGNANESASVILDLAHINPAGFDDILETHWTGDVCTNSPSNTTSSETSTRAISLISFH